VKSVEALGIPMALPLLVLLARLALSRGSLKKNPRKNGDFSLTFIRMNCLSIIM